MATKQSLSSVVASLPEATCRDILLKAAKSHPKVAEQILKQVSKPLKEPDWDDFDQSLPQYYSAISSQAPDVQMAMLEQILQNVVLDVDSRFHNQLLRIHSDQRFSAFFQPWYSSSYPPRRLSKMAVTVGCKDAENFPGVVIQKMINLVVKQKAKLGYDQKDWSAFKERVQGYKEALMEEEPFLFDNREVPVETLLGVVEKEALGAQQVGTVAVLKRPAGKRRRLD
eukprot:gnl/MRDRNA2_/MRDRNA2_88056_c0_seq1.p1 gnl/MRDRNA2_/MRDRNA2_88056_c0~~gnl/MRDRNA2_/MRDRNA2_88056_c0_seq1.p1  ORF type:complete len:226 (+),score=50.08 gnl/MRDRNA2_/MRDRNA2_88056_c0_seq1:78-755(+)